VNGKLEDFCSNGFMSHWQVVVLYLAYKKNIETTRQTENRHYFVQGPIKRLGEKQMKTKIDKTGRKKGRDIISKIMINDGLT
jgi:hypothetical protein